MKNIFYIFLLIVVSISCTTTNKETADTIYINGKIYTVNEAQPWAEAIAIKDGKFIKVGSTEEMKTFIGEKTEVTDLEGKIVLPGFIDSHSHALGAAEDNANLSFKNSDNADAMLTEIKAYAEANPDLKVIRGGIWNLGVFPGDNPHKKLLDEIVPDRLVYLISQSGHSAWLNSKALELAGIDKDTPITHNFIYSKDKETGEPTGRIDEYAMAHVESLLPPTETSKLEKGIKIVQHALNAYGVTSVKLAEGREVPTKAALGMDKKDMLSLRMIISWDWGSHYSPHNAEQAEVFASKWKDYSSEMIDARHIKIFYDGGLDTYTAKLLEDYEGKPGVKGGSHKTKKEFEEAITRMNANGIGVIVHVMGDASAKELVDIFENVRAKNGDNGVPLHLSHAIMARSEDLLRLGKIKDAYVDFSPAIGIVVPELAALFKTPIGEERFQKQFNVKSAIEAGVPTGLGSDWPASIIPEPNTFWYLSTWVNRKLPGVADAQTQNIDQAITIEQAIKAYTLGSAQCMGFDWSEKIGSIEEGKYADFIIIDRNVFEIPTSEIHEVLVEKTIIGGKVVFDRTADEEVLNVVDIEITNESLNNAVDAEALNLLIQTEEFGGRTCLVDHEHKVSPGSSQASEEINNAFSEVVNQGYECVTPAREIDWKEETYWIQWMLNDSQKSLWAYDPELGEAVKVLQIKK